MTGDENWTRKGQKKPLWLRGKEPAKAELTIRMFFFWNFQGLNHYELPSYGQTLNSVLYCQQLDCQKEACASSGQRQATHIDSKSPETPIGCEVLKHPLYNPDHAPSFVSDLADEYFFYKPKFFKFFFWLCTLVHSYKSQSLLNLQANQNVSEILL